MLWWIPLSWFERPITTPPESAQELNALRVTVQVPVYNEDEHALRACLDSLLRQTRLPNRVAVVDDGSLCTGRETPYRATRDWFIEACAEAGFEATWDRTENQGKRHAQMHVLADDDGDIFVTLDSDSILDARAIEEGLKPFADPRVKSVAGSILVLNSRRNALTAMISILYVPFTRGFRAAQSVLHSVMVNSGTLAFYSADVIRKHADSYPHEQFAGRQMQMNDDSMMTLYALWEGRTVHQPSSFAFTLVPETWAHYRKQAMRWMRGTFIRTLWWLRYMPLTRPPFWMALFEITQLFLALVFGGIIVWTLITRPESGSIIVSAVVVTLILNYLIALRYFSVDRSDESLRFRLLVFALAPVAAVWRFFVLRPMQFYAIVTCRRVSQWGTRTAIEVRLDAGSDTAGAQR
ncbi:glycosyltransferase [Leucobacter viscericola]|uniref:Hyaluronan synthase n=2 Tax=Leucobacter viscericola TaxID=2714935 RepID=A0A6G7XKF6_9MICO|nr:glycosyltransferase [Leucobacter viscericola]